MFFLLLLMDIFIPKQVNANLFNSCILHRFVSMY